MGYKVAILAAVIILAGINLYPAMSLLTRNYIVSSSGSIIYFPIRPLHIEGRYIKDDQNQTVYLRGVNAGGWVDDYAGLWTPVGGYYGDSMGVWNPSAVKANLDAMKSWRINAIRSLIVADWWKNNYKNYKQNYKDFVTWAGERGIYVIAGFYQVLHWYEGGEGWTSFPYPPYISSTAAKAIIPNEQAFVDLWGNVAFELQSFPNLLFDLWNEVGADYDVNSPQMADWWTVAQDCIDAIRQYTRVPIIIDYGWGVSVDLDWPEGASSMAWVQNSSLTDSSGNLVYSTHVYRDGGGVGYWSSNNTRASARQDIERAWQLCLVDAVGEQWNKPLIIGEIGCNLNYERNQELTAFGNALAIANDWGLHYCAWIWQPTDVTEYGLLQGGTRYIPPPSASGQILINALAAP